MILKKLRISFPFLISLLDFKMGCPLLFVNNKDKARLQKFWIPREKVKRECICCFLKTMAIFLLSSMPNPKHLYNSIKEMPIYHVCSFDAGDDDDDDGDDDDDDDVCHVRWKCWGRRPIGERSSRNWKI